MVVIYAIISLLLILNGLSAIYIIIFERKRPEKTIAWLTIILLAPVLGLIVYILFGRNWRIGTINNVDIDFSQYINSDADQLNISAEYHSMIKLISANSKSPVFSNNEITIFQDGKELFSKIKEELMKAKHHIHLEYYTVRDDDVGNEIKDILINKAHSGVTIRFIIDCSGSPHIENNYIRELRQAGIDVILYCCFKSAVLRSLSTHALYRDHRKITIVDGNTAFIGGNNIGNEYIGKSKYGFWRDTHLMVKGSFVHGLQSIFLTNFTTIKKVNKHPFKLDKESAGYFPHVQDAGNKIMQYVGSGPDLQYNSTLQCMISMIHMAVHHIYITMPYFAPPQSIKEALKIAALKGVDVQILFPDQCDHRFMHYASKSHLYDLVEYGIKVHLYDRNSFIHAKVMTIDGRLCTIGSTNMDYYSFEYNYEINAVIYDSDVADKLERQFLIDIEDSHLMTENYYNEISTFNKAIQNVARVFSGII